MKSATVAVCLLALLPVAPLVAATLSDSQMYVAGLGDASALFPTARPVCPLGIGTGDAPFLVVGLGGYCNEWTGPGIGGAFGITVDDLAKHTIGATYYVTDPSASTIYSRGSFCGSTAGAWPAPDVELWVLLDGTSGSSRCGANAGPATVGWVNITQ
jgi:hypothetical protein